MVLIRIIDKVLAQNEPLGLLRPLDYHRSNTLVIPLRKENTPKRQLPKKVIKFTADDATY